MSDPQSIFLFLTDTRNRADLLLLDQHLSTEVRTVVQDLVRVAENFQDLLQQANGQSAETRFAKKKLEQAKSDIRQAETKVDTMKKMLMALVEEIKSINSETAAITRRSEAKAPDTVSAQKIRAATQKMVDIIIQAGTDPERA